MLQACGEIDHLGRPSRTKRQDDVAEAPPDAGGIVDASIDRQDFDGGLRRKAFQDAECLLATDAMPVLRVRKALRCLRAGDAITVLCTDPLAAIDIPHLVHSEGDRLDSLGEANGVLTFRITRAGATLLQPPKED